MKRLYRSKKQKLLAGVCGGIGEYFDIDPVIVRIVFVLLVLATGIFPFVIAYGLVAWWVPVASSHPYNNIVSEQ